MPIARLENGQVVPGNPESFMRIYPMGFVPAIKERLLGYAKDNLTRLQPLSEVTVNLQTALESLKLPESDLPQFFEMMRILGQGIQDGMRATEEELEFITHGLLTEEELAVVFAKISRNPGSFQEIARSVTAEGAAQFHQRWVVSVEGYGHASVAEHAVVHQAVENVPSLDGDELTDNRLASFTEFSARFKGRQDVGWFIPEAVAADLRLLNLWNEAHLELFEAHDRLFEKGKVYITTDEAKQKHPGRRVKDKTVADQFKNLMPASRLTSAGVTMNAREAENSIRKMLSSPHESVREMGQRLKAASLEVAPTLVKYAEPSEYLVTTRNGIARLVEERRWQGYIPEVTEEGRLVQLVDYDPRAESKFIAAALYREPDTGSLNDLLKVTDEMDGKQRREVIGQLLGKMGKWDSPIRALEFAGDYLWEIQGMTYGDWREWKRHRMETYQAKDLDVLWGYMIPPLAVEMDQSVDGQFHGSVETIKKAIGKIEEVFEKVAQIDPAAAQYLVTRLHYRPAIVKFNLREGFHFVNLRSGPTAHPFIRRLTWPVFDEMNAVHPLLMEHLRLRIEAEGRPDRNFHYTY